MDADVPVDAVARVPAGSGLLGVVGPDGDDIVRAVQLDVVRNIIIQRQIAERPVSQQVLVDPHVAVGHHAAELDVDPLAGQVLAVEFQRLAVPADPAAQITAAPLDGAVLGVVVFDPPVVGDVEQAPCRVVEIRAPGAFGIAAQESPRFVDVDGGPGFRRIQGTCSCQKQDAEQ